jgi:hypothetical protein
MTNWNSYSWKRSWSSSCLRSFRVRCMALKVHKAQHIRRSIRRNRCHHRSVHKPGACCVLLRMRSGQTRLIATSKRGASSLRSCTSKRSTLRTGTRLRSRNSRRSSRTPQHMHRVQPSARNPRRHRGSPHVPLGYTLGNRTARRNTNSLRSRSPRQTLSRPRNSSREPTRP